jgi:N-acetylglucosamine malate deacetylase 1
MNRTVLTFLAHPDDAEMLCAGTLVRLADLGWDVHIATSVMGDCGSATLPADEIAQIRHREATAAAELIGATYHCLGERDTDIIFDHNSNRKAIDLFREIAPSLVLTHPRLDYMLDHEQTHLLARSAAFAYSIPNASKLPLKEGSAIPHLYYCDPIDAIDHAGNVVEPTTLIDVTDQMERKTQMLACHVSQREWLQAHHGMDEYIESMKRHSALRGQNAGTAYAEAFVQHRGHAFPSNDLLKKLLCPSTKG